MIETLKRSRPRGGPALRVPHPAFWLGIVVLLAAVLATSGYLAVRRPYDAAHQRNWSYTRRHVYELWTLDISAPVRFGVLLALFCGVCYASRRYRQAVLVRAPGPIAVEDLVNATGSHVNLDELSTAFRTSLGRVDLNSPASVPGAGRPTEFLELLRGVASEKTMMGRIIALIGLTAVTHAYRVRAVLRKRDDDSEPCGITVTVATLPHGGAPPCTVWAKDWDAAVERAAVAVGAAVLPLTRLCRRPPWAQWRRRDLPHELFAAYLDGKDLVAQRRYDEALGKFREALSLDPFNLYIRLEIGSLNEQLGLFLDALEMYDDVIAIGGRADDRFRYVWRRRALLLWDLVRRKDEARQQAEERARHWRGRRGRRGIRAAAWSLRRSDRHQALLIARYRYATVLGFAEVSVGLWVCGNGGKESERERRELDELRSRLVTRLTRYRFKPHHYDEERAEPAKDDDLRPQGKPSADDVLRRARPIEASLRADLKRELRRVIRRGEEAVARVPHRAEFEDQLGRTKELLDEQHPPRPDALKAVACTLLTLSETDEKPWDEVRRVALKTKRALATPNTMDVLRAQELFQQASLAEVKQLIKDYRWTSGRRRGRQAVAQRALRVGKVTAKLRLRRVEWLIDTELGVEPTRRRSAAAADWPPPVHQVRDEVAGALGVVHFPANGWQDFYNAACVYAVPLLHRTEWAGRAAGLQLADEQPRDAEEGDRVNGRRDDFADHAVRELERAADASASHFAAGRRSWLTEQDPDLAAFRETRQYARFRNRNIIGSEHAVPENVDDLQRSVYVAELIRTLASAMIRPDVGGLPADANDRDMARWIERDRQSWRYVGELTREGDWHARLRVLEYLQALHHSHSSPVTFPTYPDARIGDPDDVSERHNPKRVSDAGRHACDERDKQLEWIGDIAGGPIAGQRPAEVQLAALSPRNRRDLVSSRSRAWMLLRDYLGVRFFTDDEDDLALRRRDASKLATQLGETVRRAVTVLDASVLAVSNGHQQRKRSKALPGRRRPAEAGNVFWLGRAEQQVPPDGSWLFEAESERARMMRFTKRRTEFLVARWTAKQALARVLGVAGERAAADRG